MALTKIAGQLKTPVPWHLNGARHHLVVHDSFYVRLMERFLIFAAHQGKPS